MKTTVNDKNLVFLRGRVQGLYTSPKVSRLYVQIKDYQQKANEDGRLKKNVITVTFYGETGEKQLQGLKKYDHVDVKGVIQSTRDPKTGMFGQECWGISVAPTRTLLELASKGEAKGSVYPEDDNVVYLRGKVSSAHAYSPHWFSLSIKTGITSKITGRKYISNTQVSMYSEDAAKSIQRYGTTGTEVMAVGKLESTEKLVNGKTQRFISVTLKDIVSVAEEKRKTDLNIVETVLRESGLPEFTADEDEGELPLPDDLETKTEA